MHRFILSTNIYQQSATIRGLMEDEVYVFAVTAVNQAGESMINASIMVQTNESSELKWFTCTMVLCTFPIQLPVYL